MITKELWKGLFILAVVSSIVMTLITTVFYFEDTTNIIGFVGWYSNQLPLYIITFIIWVLKKINK